jgi:hypothetical protein
MQLHFHISRHIAHLGWETPVFFTLLKLPRYSRRDFLEKIDVQTEIRTWAIR